MKYIFLDESGDLGFSKKSSKYLIITLMVCDVHEEPAISRIVKKTRQKIIKKKLRKYPEIKWNNSSHSVKRKILGRISESNVEIFSIVLEKARVYDYLQQEKHKLYNYLCRLIISECSLNNSKIELFVDRSKGKRALRDDFDNYIRNKIIVENCDLEIIHADSKKNGGLQTLDFVSGAIFNKYEFGNEEFYKLIRNKISIERRLFSNPDPGD